MAEWTETFKGAIPTSEYDPNAYMNTQTYVSRFDQATWFLLSTIGITPRKAREFGRRIAVIRQALQFVHELRGGELVTIHSGLISVGHKHLRFVHRMADAENGQLVATSDCTAVSVDLETDKSVELSTELVERAKSLLVTINDAERVDIDAQV
jgi:acyl-CoA thioesterase FadM